jgi:hypothetical protein
MSEKLNDISQHPLITEWVNKLPTSWDQMTFETYERLLQCRITEDSATDITEHLLTGVQNSVKEIAAILNVSPETLEKAHYSVIQRMAARTQFILTEPAPGKPLPWFKKEDEIDYATFTALQILCSDPVNNMAACVALLSKEPLTIEQVRQKSVTEVHTAFFTLLKYSKRLLRRSARSEARKLVKQAATNLKPKIVKRLYRRN